MLVTHDKKIADLEYALKENKKRQKRFCGYHLDENSIGVYPDYDPIKGNNSLIERFPIKLFSTSKEPVYLPLAMKGDKLITAILIYGGLDKVAPIIGKSLDDVVHTFCQVRNKHDFEYWAFSNVKVQDKMTKGMIPFLLRYAQRKLLAELERMRLAKIPIRLILLKARQWGGSTLIQIYLAWMQNIHKKNWHSAIVADANDKSKNIRSMYSKLAKEYPVANGTISFRPFEGSTNVKTVVERGCNVGIGSVNNPDFARSYDYAMLHLSEVGLWPSTEKYNAEDLVQALRATVPFFPDTMIALESTAKGVGNLFHREWLAAESGKSSYSPFFVAWFEIEIYQAPIEDYADFVANMNDYDWELWSYGATLEGICWYNKQLDGENYDDWRMKEEFPSTPAEAFQSSGQRVFPVRYVAKARRHNRKPIAIGEVTALADSGSKDALKDIKFELRDRGNLRIYQFPNSPKGERKIRNRYAIYVDIGGTTDKSDYSVISVVDRYWMLFGGSTERAAIWKGHVDIDKLAWIAIQIGTYYQNAVIAFEVNMLGSRGNNTEGVSYLTVYNEISHVYPYLYSRTDPGKVKDGAMNEWGFYLTEKSKNMIINGFKKATREGSYIEYASSVCDEMDFFEYKQSGAMGAITGQHDDELIATAGSLWLSESYVSPPYMEKHPDDIKPRKKGGDAIF